MVEVHKISKYGFWHPYVMNVIYRYLDCGDRHFGFARVRCSECGHEYLLAFSCKRRHFCPSCHQKRVVEFGEHLHKEVLKDVSHSQWVLSIPKRLRLISYMIENYFPNWACVHGKFYRNTWSKVLMLMILFPVVSLQYRHLGNSWISIPTCIS